MKKYSFKLLLMILTLTSNAVSAATTSTTISPTQFTILAAPPVGTITNKTVSVTIKPDSSIVGQPGSLFVAALMPDGVTWYSNNGSGWEIWNPSSPLPAYSTSTSLPATNIITPALNMNLASVVGANLYVGYGSSYASMLSNGTYAPVFIVTQPVPTGSNTQGSAYQQLHRDIIISADVYANTPQILAANFGFGGITAIPGLLSESQIQLAYNAGAGVVSNLLGLNPAAPFRNITSGSSPIGVQSAGFSDSLVTQTFMDAMPIEFSHPIRPSTLSPNDFMITLNTGKTVTPLYAAINPNYDHNERQTVVVFGYFGNRLQSNASGAIYPTRVDVVSSAVPLQLITPNGPVSAVGLNKTSSNPYDTDNGPKLLAAKLSVLSLAGDYPPPYAANVPGNHGIQYYGNQGNLYRLRLLTGGGFSPDGVSGFLPQQFSSFFTLQVVTSGGQPLTISQSQAVYQVMGGTIEVLGIADLGPGLPATPTYTYLEDHDNQFDIIIQASTIAAIQSLQSVTIPATPAYSPTYNPGGPGTNPTQGVNYTQPAPAQVVPIQFALTDPVTVSFAAQKLNAYDQATGIPVAFRLISTLTSEMRLTSSSIEASGLVQSGLWQLVDVPFATNPSDTLMVNIQALYNPQLNDAVYTSDQNRIVLLQLIGYHNNGVVFTAYDTNYFGLTPVYELYSKGTGKHYYTSSLQEMQLLITNQQMQWQDERIAFYTVSFQGSSPVNPSACLYAWAQIYFPDVYPAGGSYSTQAPYCGFTGS